MMGGKLQEMCIKPEAVLLHGKKSNTSVTICAKKKRSWFQLSPCGCVLLAVTPVRALEQL